MPIDLMQIQIQYFLQLRIRIHIPMRIQIQFQNQGFDDQKLKKNIQLEIFFIFWSKIKAKGYPSYRRSLQPSNDNIQHLKTSQFFIILFLWVTFAVLNPDPGVQIADPDPAQQIK